MFKIFGNRGEYVMPGSPEFTTREEAIEYRNRWWHDNRFVVVGYVHTGFEAGAL